MSAPRQGHVNLRGRSVLTRHLTQTHPTYSPAARPPIPLHTTAACKQLEATPPCYHDVTLGVYAHNPQGGGAVDTDGPAVHERQGHGVVVHDTTLRPADGVSTDLRQPAACGTICDMTNEEHDGPTTPDELLKLWGADPDLRVPVTIDAVWATDGASAKLGMLVRRAYQAGYHQGYNAGYDDADDQQGGGIL